MSGRAVRKTAAKNTGTGSTLTTPRAPAPAAALPAIRLGESAPAGPLRVNFALCSALHRKLVRRWRATLSALARTDLDCTCSAVGIDSDDAGQGDHTTFVSTHRYPLASGGSVAILLPSDCVIAATERFYGGTSPVRVTHRVVELSATEDWMAGRIADSIVTGLAAVLPDSPDVARPHRDHHRAAAFPGDWPDCVARVGITVEGLAAEAVTIEILYPLATLRAIEAALQPVHNGPDVDAPASRFHALRSAMGDIRLQARIVLSRPEVSLSRLMALSEGDLVRIAVPQSLPLLVDDRVLATGTLGAIGGMAAFRIHGLQEEPATP